MDNRSQMTAIPVPQGPASKAWGWVVSILLLLALTPVYVVLFAILAIEPPRQIIPWETTPPRR